jgi:hypothetical protein
MFGDVMRDLLGDARQRLAREIDTYSAPQWEPIVADPWIVSSLLQKSIRRSEIEIAQRAALTLFKSRGSAIWRRFMVIAFEDVGIGSIDAVTMTVAVGSDAACRKACGGDLRVAVHLAGVLANAPKDRSADHLAGAKDHPALAGFVQAMANASIALLLSSVRDTALDLTHRAVATWLASGIGVDDGIARGNLEKLLALFRDAGVPEGLVAATGIAAGRTREPITVMVPLIWLAAATSQQSVCDCPVPPLTRAGGVPLYALDEHTRLGREAIWRFACENDSVRACLERFAPANRRRAANVAAFYADAAPVTCRLMWDQSRTLETFGTERDLLLAGVPAEGIGPLLEAVRANLGHLNELRTQILGRTRAEPVGVVVP